MRIFPSDGRGRATEGAALLQETGGRLAPSRVPWVDMKMPRALLPTIADALEAHSARLAACRRCALGESILPITSAARAPRGMLVGQAPGQTETGGGRPFAGRAGRTLFKWFDSIGLDEAGAREALYIAAITRCYPG